MQTNTNIAPTPTGNEPPQQNEPTQNQSTTPTTPTTPPPANFNLEETLRELKETRTENQNLRARFKKQEEEAAASLKKEMEEQGQWKSLAEQHEVKVKELEPKAAELAEIAEMLSQQIDAETKDWPKSVKALDPGPDASIKERLAWRTKGQAIIAEMQGQARAQSPGNPPNPRSLAGSQQQQAGVEELSRRWQVQHGKPF